MTDNLDIYDDPVVRERLQYSLDALDQIEAMTAADAAIVPEPVFVQHLLPILVNRSGTQNLSVWADLAGHVMRPIDVTDPTTGDVLFRVPAVLRREVSLYKGGRENSVYEILSTAKKKSEVMPKLGDQYIKTRLVDRIPATKFNLEDLVVWNQILERYGYEPVIKTTKSETVEETKPNTDFTGEYDDL